MKEILFCAPGYLIAAAYALSAISFCFANPPRFPLWKRILIWTALLAVEIIIAIVTDLGINALIIPVQLLVFFVAYAILKLTCAITVRNALYFTILAFIFGELMASLSYHAYLLLFHDITSRAWMPQLVICFAVTAVILCGCIALIEQYNKDYNSHCVSVKELLLTLLVVMVFFLLANYLASRYEQPFTEASLLKINVIRAIMDLAGVGVISAIRMARIAIYKNREMQAMKSLMRQQQNNYQVSEQSMALIHQKYHDMKHQIELWRTENGDEAQRIYLDRLERELQPFEAEVHTGNAVLDIILSSKTLLCQDKGIRLTCIADGKLLDFMNEMDLCALLGNLLDNAIESTEKLSEPERRWIQFSLRRNNDFILVETGNSYEGELRFEGGIPVSTKDDAQSHGYGTKSIRQIAAQYGGRAIFTARDGWFEAKVLFDRPESGVEE